MSYTNGLDKPSDYFVTKLYSGNAGTLNITGLDFQPDWVAIKDKDATNSFMTFDSVRGVTKLLSWNTNALEATVTPTLTSFNSDGFSIGNNTALNTNGNNLVAWNWKAGTSFTNDASGTGIGSIDSSGSVNTDAGFSIVSYTGTGSVGTIAHGLGAVPSMYILKRRAGDTENWPIYHQSVGNTHALYLNTTDAIYDYANFTNDTSPTSSVFTVGGSNNQANPDGSTMIAYCFAEKQGYSKFGSYIANANANGIFEYTGFKPAFLMIKNTAQATDWIMYDNKRDGFEPQNKEFATNLNAVEANAEDNNVQFCANGFKVRNAGTKSNADSGDNLIYMCFAEQPFVTSTGVPATAR